MCDVSFATMGYPGTELEKALRSVKKAIQAANGVLSGRTPLSRFKMWVCYAIGLMARITISEDVWRCQIDRVLSHARDITSANPRSIEAVLHNLGVVEHYLTQESL